MKSLLTSLYHSTVYHISMQNPTDQAEAASIPTETVVREQGPNLNQHQHHRTFTVHRKAAKRSTLQAEAEAIPARKKQRLEEPLSTAASTTTDEATRKTTSSEVSVDLPPPVAAARDDANNADLVSYYSQHDAEATRATGRWTPEEDTKLTSAVNKIK
jgi:hypothetical protein